MQLLKRLQTPSLPLQIVLVTMAALLWFLPDLCGKSYPHNEYAFTILGQLTWFTLPAFWAHFVQFWVVLLVAVWVNALCNSRRVFGVRSTMPFVCLLVVASCAGRVQFFSASTIAFLLFLYAVSQLLAMYGTKRECVSEAFKLGTAIICAAIFDQPYIWLVPLPIVGMIVFSTLTKRTFCAFVAGLLLPAALLAECLALTDTWPLLKQAADITRFAGLAQISWPTWSELSLTIGIAIMLMVAIGSYVSSSTIFNLNIRLNYIFMCIVLALTLLLALFTGWSETLLLPPILCATFIISFYFTTNNSKFAHTLFILFAVCCTACRVLMLFGL